MSAAQYQVCTSCGRWTFNVASASCESVRCTSLFRADPLTPRLPYLAEERPVGRRRETFVVRALRSFTENVSESVARARAWRERTLDMLQDRLSDLLWERGRERAHALIRGLSAGLWAGLSLVFALKTGVGLVLLGLLVLTAIASVCISVFLTLGVVLASVLWLLVLAPALVLAAFVLRLAFDSGVQAAVLAGRLSLLVPLAAFVAATRAKQVWDGIFFTCPSRTCAYRGLPVYVCPGCGEGARSLRPNLYGLLRHECASCGARLPTLDGLGRGRLERRCGGCEMPLWAGTLAARASGSSPSPGAPAAARRTTSSWSSQRRRRAGPR